MIPKYSSTDSKRSPNLRDKPVIRIPKFRRARSSHVSVLGISARTYPNRCFLRICPAIAGTIGGRTTRFIIRLLLLLSSLPPRWPSCKMKTHSNYFKFIFNGYSPPLTNLAAQIEFSQPQKDCSGSSKDGHGLKFERWIVELI